MRRQKLVWFAAGLACSALVTMIAALALRHQPPERGWYLRVAEKSQSLSDGRDSAEWRGAEIARDCGAQNFEMIPAFGADGVDGTRIPLTRANNPALGCVVERAREAELWIGVDLEPLRTIN